MKSGLRKLPLDLEYIRVVSLLKPTSNVAFIKKKKCGYEALMTGFPHLFL